MNPHKILFVDDDLHLLAALQRTLRRNFIFDTAPGGQEAIELIQSNGPYALLVVDMRMPVMDGLEFLEKAKSVAPHAVRIMLTGNADQETAAEAVNRGQVFKFLNKPCPLEILLPVIESGLKQFEMLSMERELLEGTLTGSVKLMSEVLGMVAPEALGRGQRLRQAMRQFAKFCGAAPAWELEIAALLSPIGHASLPAAVLQKISAGEELTTNEQTMLRRVPQIGHDLLSTIPRLGGVARIVLYQNKGFDGSGVPGDHVSGEDIPLGARMLKILTDRLALEVEGVVKQVAFDTMKGRVGAYDPQLLGLCFDCFGAFVTNAISAEGSVRSLHIIELVEGQIVVSDITTKEGLVLVPAGTQISAMILAHLLNYNSLGEVKQPVLVQDPAPKTNGTAQAAA